VRRVADARRHLGEPSGFHAALVALRLAGGDGLELAHEIRSVAPAIHVLITSRVQRRGIVNRLYALGFGHALEPLDDGCIDALFARARSVAPGVSRTPPLMMSDGALESWMETVAAAPALAGLSLPRRKLQVLALAVAGFQRKEIAAALGISPNTVKHHIAWWRRETGVELRDLATMVRLRRCPAMAPRPRGPRRPAASEALVVAHTSDGTVHSAPLCVSSTNLAMASTNAARVAMPAGSSVHSRSMSTAAYP
jgi:DNA-binding NarL/FixJ family response regulator